MITHSKKHLVEHINEGCLNWGQVLNFKRCKVPKWTSEEKVQQHSLSSDYGLKAELDNELFIIDNDHVQDYPTAYEKLLEVVWDWFGDDVGLIKQSYNPKKFKLVFVIQDPHNKHVLAQYGDAFNVIAENHNDDKDLEFFGACKEKQCCKISGTYPSKQLVTEEEVKNFKGEVFIEKFFDKKKKIYKDQYYGVLGEYNGIFTVIELFVSDLCEFLNELLYTGLFEIHDSKKKEETSDTPKDNKKDPNAYLDNIRNAKKTNDVYCHNALKYIDVCRKNNWSLEECLAGMDQVLTERNIYDEKYANFEKNAKEKYKLGQYFDDKCHFYAYKMAEELINEHNIVKYQNNVYYYANNRYNADIEHINGYMLNKCKHLTKKHRNEVLSYIQDTHDIKTIDKAEPNLIAFNNGVLNIDTNEFTKNSSAYFIQNIIPHNYNAAAFDEELDNALNMWSCNNEQIRSLLEECIGYCLFRKNFLQKCFILSGDKNNGKSTFIYILQKALGLENMCSMDLQDLGANYQVAQLFNKLANIGDDIKGDYLPDTSIFKKLVTGDIVNARNIREAPFDFEPYAKLIFSCNDIPKMKDVTGAVKRRLIIIPFNADFSNVAIPGLKYKLSSENAIEFLLKIGVIALKRLLQNKQFTECSIVNQTLEDYSKENDNLTQWLYDYVVEFRNDNLQLKTSEFKDSDITNEDVILSLTNRIISELYTNYTIWCYQNNITRISNITFTKTFTKRYNLEVVRKKKDGTIHKWFCKQ